jgi:TPR repeat protein
MRLWVLIVVVIAVARGGEALAADDPAVVAQRVADYNLGTKYLDGTGVAKDYPKALGLFEKAAAAAGSVDAMCNVGWMHSHGLGAPVDYAEAMRWYRKAADEEAHGGGMYHVGYCYEKRRGVARSMTEARRWYKKAADAGDEDAKSWMAGHSGN